MSARNLLYLKLKKHAAVGNVPTPISSFGGGAAPSMAVKDSTPPALPAQPAPTAAPVNTADMSYLAAPAHLNATGQSQPTYSQPTAAPIAAASAPATPPPQQSLPELPAWQAAQMDGSTTASDEIERVTGQRRGGGYIVVPDGNGGHVGRRTGGDGIEQVGMEKTNGYQLKTALLQKLAASRVRRGRLGDDDVLNKLAKKRRKNKNTGKKC